VQSIYIRKVEKVDGELYNVEFQTFEAVRTPARRRSDCCRTVAVSCLARVSLVMPGLVPGIHVFTFLARRKT